MRNRHAAAEIDEDWALRPPCMKA